MYQYKYRCTDEGNIPVKPSPAEGFLDISSALETLHHFKDIEVLNVSEDVVVDATGVLLSNHNTFLE